MTSQAVAFEDLTPEKIDARKRRTKTVLHDAFLQLLQQKSLEQISIREIATVAGIGHTTFYRHYVSKDALLNDLAADEIRRITRIALPIMDTNSTYDACVALCAHVIEKRKLWTILLTGGAAGTVKDEWLKISRQVAGESVRASADKNILELGVILTVSGILETLAWWLRQEIPATPDRVARILNRVITLNGEMD